MLSRKMVDKIEELEYRIKRLEQVVDDFLKEYPEHFKSLEDDKEDDFTF